MFGGRYARPLRSAQLAQAQRLAARNLPANMLLANRLRELEGTRGRTAREFYAAQIDGELVGLVWLDANICAVASQPEAIRMLALPAQRHVPRASAIFGDRATTEALFAHMGRVPVREYRWSQPLLEALANPLVPDHPGLHPATQDDADEVFRVSVEMFIEEVGVDPCRHDGGRSYRARVGSLIELGRTYIVREAGRIVFKADIGAVVDGRAEMHGVWVDPLLRGRGLGSAAIVATTRAVMETHAPRVSLYVNDYNLAARRVYEKAGYRQIGELSTLLL
ncbi:GNAT family N-acetyltransferase [Dermabacteraceae bacterium P13095]